MDTEKKNITVIMPSFNCGRFLDHSVLSVFSQITSHRITLMISNDCSTDNTLEILERIKNNFTREDFEILIFNQEKNLGEVNNTKFLLDNCNGDYIAYLDADDFWIDPHKLETQINFLEKNSDYSMCFTGYLTYDNNTGGFVPIANGQCWLSPTLDIDIGSPITPDMLLDSNPVSSSSRVFRNYKNLIADYFYNFPYSDWPMNFEISLLGKIKFLNFCSYCYRIHDTSLTSMLKNNTKKNLEVYNRGVEILKERYKWKNSI
jgi:glycosyltransferase involved in cell wall biosynthesis